MKAPVLGRPFKIRWAGGTDLIYTEDVANAMLGAAGSSLDGARVDNLHGASFHVADVVAGVRRTLDELARLQGEGRLDGGELG
jgi:hypothetical protein